MGNSTQSNEFLSFLSEISPNISIVRGEFDNPKISIPKVKATDTKGEVSNNPDENKEELPLTSIIKVGDFRIGCCSGYTVVPKNDPVSLLILARQLNVDILLWSGTHNVEAYTLEGKFFVNPGSCTGAFNSDWPIMDDLPLPQEQSQQNNSSTTSAVETDTKEDEVVSQDNSTEKTAVEEPKQEKQEEEQEINEEDIDIPDSVATGSNTPSFCLLDIQNSTCTLYIYIYVDGDVRVDKVVYKKNDSPEDNQPYN